MFPNLGSCVFSTIGQIAKDELSDPSYPSFAVIEADDEYCADTGATDPMLNDYKFFISYHPCVGRYDTLGGTCTVNTESSLITKCDISTYTGVV